MSNIQPTTRAQNADLTRTQKYKIALCISLLVMSILTIIAIGWAGIAGVIPGSTLGYSLFGIGIVSSLTMLCWVGRTANIKKLSLVLAPLLICGVIGGLGIAGVIPGPQLGGTMAGSILIAILIAKAVVEFFYRRMMRDLDLYGRTLNNRMNSYTVIAAAG
ncbi:MAG: hypothetical protein R3E91_04890 [Chlamydiales bacterium]